MRYYCIGFNSRNYLYLKNKRDELNYEVEQMCPGQKNNGYIKFGETSKN